MVDQRAGSAINADRTAPVLAVAGTLGLAAACWVVAVRQMNGMDMGAATELGSFGFFVSVWVAMMAAMMLPGAAPAVVRQVQVGVRTVPLFLVAYLAVWTAIGLAVYAAYRPHSTDVAGALVIAAGAYELTPLKRTFRERCRENTRSGIGFGLCCVGSSIGLMLVLLALGAMSLVWMAVIAVVVLAQKLLPPKSVVDVPLALVIIALGVLTILAPSSVPGLM